MLASGNEEDGQRMELVAEPEREHNATKKKESQRG